MFILHSSNKTENLLAHLTSVLSSAPLNLPFAKEVFLIQSQGMERWLSQQLASEYKVWGNYGFLFPNEFFSSLARQIDSNVDDSAFDRRMMLWRFEAMLRNLEDNTFRPLQYYLSGENVVLKRFQLAQQLAQIFDQYQMMRPNLLAAWQNGELLYQTETEQWQKALWQQITSSTGYQHRGSLWQDIIKILDTAPENSFSGQLPERVSVFGLNTMPPLFLAFLQALSKHCQIHFYLLNPAQTYWADLQNKRQIAKSGNLGPLDQTLLGHPLLATLGQQGRKFQELLLEQTQFKLEFESFESVNAKNNLQQLQNDILNNQASPSHPPLDNDGSISIHSCHSRNREVQVLKNQLLSTLEKDTSLELRDIVVMAPDIQVYAPFVTAVFANIQHAIADRSLQLSNTMLDTLLRFLRLSQSRFGWQAVLDLLEQPVVYRSFDLSETDLELIKHWISDTNIRWARSAEHKQELGLPATPENTWQAGLDRLLMGYAIADDQVFIDGILPYSEIEGSLVQALGGLCEFMQMLSKASTELTQARTLQQWSGQLFCYADQLLDTDPFDTALQSERQLLNELITELSDGLAEIHHDRVDLEVIICWLETTITERKSSSGFLRGQLTFCSMLPMRSIPFKVIALLGLNEGEFPKVDRQPTFDLLSQNYQKGDRSRRADDRYQFLEVLLSAQQQLIITYIGQSISQNETVPPSVVISELLEILEKDYQLSQLVIQHPLQAFSPKYFTDNKTLFSYSESDCLIAATLQKQNVNKSHWWQGALIQESITTIDLNELFAFYRHPQKYFFQRQLGIRFEGITSGADECEPFAIGGIEAYQIYQQWIAEQLSAKTFSVDRLQAQGRWLSGALGTLEFERLQEPINAFVESIKEKNLGETLVDCTIDLKVNQYRLLGKLGNLYDNGSLFYRYTKLKGKDFILAWLHHLLMNQIQEQTTFLLSEDKDLQLPSSFAPQDILLKLIELFIRGRTDPNLFFVEPAFAYIQQDLALKHEGRTSKPAIDVAIDQWLKSIESGYEPELMRLYQTIEDPGLILNEDFENHCQTLLQPVWKVAHEH
jgi:exodeoxyribonuclease V gamma subunit